MRNHPKVLRTFLFAFLCLASSMHVVKAEPVWHCSRSDVQVADASDTFTLAALSLEREVIRISLRDLHTIYQGSPVRLNGGLPLSACVVAQESVLTNSALRSVGAKPATLQALVRQSTLSKSHIFIVPNESEMISCIGKNHPAIGYLSNATHTEAVGPCF